MMRNVIRLNASPDADERTHRREFRPEASQLRPPCEVSGLMTAPVEMSFYSAGRQVKARSTTAG
jgi:hypothetical protein